MPNDPKIDHILKLANSMNRARVQGHIDTEPRNNRFETTILWLTNAFFAGVLAGILARELLQ